MSIDLRPPERVMRLARMGSAHPMRLSFLRHLLRRFVQEGWSFDRPVWEIDAHGVGRAVYRAKGPDRSYSLVAFAHELPDDMRSDRVIAEAWDATFCLFDGTPTEDDLARLAQNVPYQEAGRLRSSELSLSRANRSVRLWEYVVDALAKGQQPEAQRLAEVGYLMRTTAVYGSGKFGAADRSALSAHTLAQAPFQIEMLNVYLIRCFVMDLVEHMARARNANAAVLDPALRRQCGIGNSTGLGMAPFLVNHPRLLHAWIQARETALLRVRQLPSASTAQVTALHDALLAAQRNAADWHSEHPLQVPKLAHLRQDLQAIAQQLQHWDPHASQPWNALWCWGEQHLSLEGQEQLLALLIEPHGALVDTLCDTMAADETQRPSAQGDIGTLRQRIEQDYAWALRCEFASQEDEARFWYVSQNKLEPRLGQRFEEPGAEREYPLDVGRAVQRLHHALSQTPDDTRLARWLLHNEAHRWAAKRVLAHLPYAEIQDNLVSQALLPIDMLRCKLAFFGASHFDPRSDRWVRICLFQHAPFPHELEHDRTIAV